MCKRQIHRLGKVSRQKAEKGWGDFRRWVLLGFLDVKRKKTIKILLEATIHIYPHLSTWLMDALHRPVEDIHEGLLGSEGSQRSGISAWCRVNRRPSLCTFESHFLSALSMHSFGCLWSLFFSVQDGSGWIWILFLSTEMHLNGSVASHVWKLGLEVRPAGELHAAWRGICDHKKTFTKQIHTLIYINY